MANRACHKLKFFSSTGGRTARSRRMQSSSFASRVASLSRTLALNVRSNSASSVPYGVGAGDSAGEGDSVVPSVFGGVFFAALCRVRDGVGDGLATAAAVVVAVVPCFCVQEAINAMPISAVIKHNTYLFIGCQFQFESRRMFGCLKSSQHAINEAVSITKEKPWARFY